MVTWQYLLPCVSETAGTLLDTMLLCKEPSHKYKTLYQSATDVGRTFIRSINILP